MRHSSVLCALLLVPAVACAFHEDDASVTVTVRVGDTVALAVGQTAVVQDMDIKITFVAVLSDSRCPSDAVCATLGDAKMRLRAESGGMNTGQADVGLFDHTSLTYQSLEFTVESLDPWPKSADGTPPVSRYRAVIRTRPAISG